MWACNNNDLSINSSTIASASLVKQDFYYWYMGRRGLCIESDCLHFWLKTLPACRHQLQWLLKEAGLWPHLHCIFKAVPYHFPQFWLPPNNPGHFSLVWYSFIVLTEPNSGVQDLWPMGQIQPTRPLSTSYTHLIGGTCLGQCLAQAVCFQIIQAKPDTTVTLGDWQETDRPKNDVGR